MAEREKEYRKRAKGCKQKRIDRAQATHRFKEEDSKRKRAKSLSAPVPVIPRTTHSFIIRTAHVQARMQRKCEQIKRELENQARRRAKRRETSLILTEVIRNINRDQRMNNDGSEAHKADAQARESWRKNNRA